MSGSPTASGTIAAINITSLAQDLIYLGVQKQAIETVLGFSLSSIEDEEERLPVQKLVVLEEASPRLTENPAIGLELGELGEMDESKTGIVGYIARHSPDMGAAIRQAIRYSNLISDAIKMELRQTENAAVFIYTRPFPNTYSITGAEMALTRMIGSLRAVIGEGFQLFRARFTHSKPDYLQKYQSIFGTELAFEQPICALSFPLKFLKIKIPGAQDYLHTILKERAEQQLSAFKKQGGLSYQVSRLILENLASGEANVQLIAEQLHISRQTLFRQLKAENTTFQSLLDDMRKSLAAEYLQKDLHSINETAFLLGFSEASAFHRAFKRWHGITPNQYLQKWD